MADPLSISELANLALDKAYNQTAGRVLQQVDRLTNSPTSPLQKALGELEAEAERLEKEGKPLTSDNATLLKALDVMAATFEATAMLIQANDNKIQASGAGIAIPTVTAKVFTPLAGEAVRSGADPLSPIALGGYLSALKQRGILWRMP